MATAAKKKAPAEKTTAVTTWEDALKARALIAKRVAKHASGGGGNFLSFKGGILAYKGNEIDGDEIDVVCLDAVMENQFYEGAYDENQRQSPSCYAFGRDEEDMKPHPDVVAAGTAQYETCADCPNNAWDSAVDERGNPKRGKACKNVFRIAAIMGEDAETPEKIKSAEVFFMKTPVTSGKNWGNYANELAAQDLPPLAFITEVSVVKDRKSQFKVLFKAKERIDNKLVGAMLEKADIVEKTIDFPYPKFEEEEAKPAARRGAAPRSAGVVRKASGAASTAGRAEVSKKAPAKKAAKY